MDTIHGELVTDRHKCFGIYAIVNLKNNKFYIGSSIDVYRRKTRHFWELEKGVHNNKHLQNAYNLDKQYFIMVLVEKVEGTDEYLREVEQKWLDELQPYEKAIGYNLSPSVNGTSGYKFTEEQSRKLSRARKGIKPKYPVSQETKDKISRANKGRIVSEETKQLLREQNLGKVASKETRIKISNSLKEKFKTPEMIQKLRDNNGNAKAIYQYSLDGELVNTWESGAQASRELGYKRENIYRVCSGRRNKYKNYIWSYEEIDFDELNNKNETKTSVKSKVKKPPHKQTAEARKKISQSRKGHGVSEETREKISKVHKGKIISEEHKQKIRDFHSIPIIQLDLEGNYIREWNSAREASREMGFSQSCISSCCRGERKTHKGFKWKLKTSYTQEVL